MGVAGPERGFAAVHARPGVNVLFDAAFGAEREVRQAAPGLAGRGRHQACWTCQGGHVAAITTLLDAGLRSRRHARGEAEGNNEGGELESGSHG
jgi:hypothetical protein